MSTIRTNVRVQPLLVTSEPPKLTASYAPTVRDENGNYWTVTQVATASEATCIAPRIESQAVQMFSSIPLISQAELTSDYKELGDALAQMSEVGPADDWGIDAPVYEAARYIAVVLRASSFPAPKIFNHGAQSVVFNWSDGADNLYLTISSDRMSALLSSPQRITRRIEIKYSEDALLDSSRFFASVRASYLQHPIVLALPSNSSDKSA